MSRDTDRSQNSFVLLSNLQKHVFSPFVKKSIPSIQVEDARLLQGKTRCIEKKPILSLTTVSISLQGLL